MKTAHTEKEAAALPQSYTNCHSHGQDTFCEDAAGNETAIEGLSSATEAHDEAGHDEDGHSHGEDGHDEHNETETHAKQNCHFHAGVEHCTGGPAKTGAEKCAKVDRRYNIPLRIGSIFIVLVTSAIAVFLPLVLRRFTRVSGESVLFTLIKQFGTGVIICTAFVHLLTHAQMMFANECVGELKYEGTTSAIAMAGILVAFSVEYAGHRYIAHRADMRSDASTIESEAEAKPAAETADSLCHGAATNDDKLSVFVMEMGIIFHSILIGITLVVAGDSVFSTLLVVIVFHQAFEGLALGTRIAALAPAAQMGPSKIMMAGLFSVITPIGMAIGIGVRNHFNGSDRETLIALGTLDAFSAGILVWVGVVEMLAHDWLYGELKRASILRTLAAGASLLSGMVLMAVLGKWA